jgi:Lrp/AsnC family transcriptional regulator
LCDIFVLMAADSEKIDDIDRRLLRLVQRDSSQSLEALAAEVSISTNACWRRIKRLEETGIIERRVALVSPDKVGLSMTVFVAVRTNDHSERWLKKFANAATQIEELVEFYRMAGETDYLLKLMVRDVRHYDQVYKRLINAVEITDVSASFAMERIKCVTELPV